MINTVNDTNNKMNENTEQKKKNVKIIVPITFSEMLLNMKIKE